jgi:hypothetical protein
VPHPGDEKYAGEWSGDCHVRELRRPRAGADSAHVFAVVTDGVLEEDVFRRDD